MMFSLCQFEAYKLWFRKSFLTFIISLFLINVAYLGYQQFLSNDIPLTAHTAISAKLESLPNEERYPYLVAQQKKLEAYMVLEQVDHLRSQNRASAKEQINFLHSQNPNIDQYRKSYKDYRVRFTKNLEQELNLFESYRKEFQKLSEYKSYLQEIQKNADTLSDVSIFKQNDSFSSANVQKTARDYRSLQSIPIVYSSEKGIVEALSPVTAMLLVLAMMMIASFLIMEERERNLFAIIRTTPNGQGKTILAKLIVLCISMLLLTTIFFISNLILTHACYGLGDLTRPMQSLASYTKCTLPISVSSFLLLFLVMKWFALCSIGIFIAGICLLCKNRVIGMASILLFLFFQYICFVMIEPNGPLHIFKYCNFYMLIQNEAILKEYMNFNFFNHPINLQIVALGFSILCFVVMSILCFIIYQHKKDMQAQPFRFPTLWKQKHLSLHVWSQECYKCLWLQKAGIIILLFIGFQVYQSQQPSIYLDRNQQIYMQYMEVLKGPYNNDKDSFLKQENQRFLELHHQQDSLREQYLHKAIDKMAYEQSNTQIEQQLSTEETFQAVQAYADYVKADTSRSFVLPYGYDAMFQSTSFLLYPFLILLIICTFALSNIFTFDYQHQIHRLIAPTSRGVKRIFPIKITIISIITAILFIAAYMPSLIRINNTFGLPGLSASITSLPSFQDFPYFLTIGQLLLITNLIRFIAIFIYCILIGYLSIKTRQQLIAIGFGLLLFLGPLLLNLISIHFLDSLSLFPMITAGNPHSFYQTLTSTLGYGTIAILSFYKMRKQHLNDI